MIWLCWSLTVLVSQLHPGIYELGTPLGLAGQVFSRLVLATVLALASCPPAWTPHTGCRVAAKGTNGLLVLKGTVLTPDGAVENGHVVVNSGRITYAGTGSASQDRAAGATILDCTGSVISPGFINTHEHVAYSTVNPLEDLGVKVSHRHDWRVGARNNTMRETDVNGTAIDATKWGELRHLFSGTTSIVGGAMATGLVRNLDYIAGLEADLMVPAAAFAVFPLDDAIGILRNGDCDYGPFAITRTAAGQHNRYIAHIGEGVDAEAANEFRCLSSEVFDVLPLPDGGGVSADIVAPNLALIHALGLTKANFDLIAKRGAHVVWSPRSNVALYGKTLDITYLLEAGINVALGSDWLPSGSATMSREALCALSVTQKSFGKRLDSKMIWEMMTINAARVAGFEKHLGSIEEGRLADIVVFGGGEGDAYARAIYTPEENIQLVMRGGKLLLAGEGLEDLATDACEQVLFGQVLKTICVVDELGTTYEEFELSLGGVYPAILPGTPPNEPSCEPI
jgi:hypothetical protein